MDFCPECGGLLSPISANELKCRRCGYIVKLGDNNLEEKQLTIKTTINHGPKSKTYIVDQDLKTMPTTKAECPKCKHKEAYYWQVQTRAGDEPSTTFFRCRKCGYTWREY
ncbi:MAG: transcription factor S [Candidatus Odinarchaeia archaeon]